MPGLDRQGVVALVRTHDQFFRRVTLSCLQLRSRRNSRRAASRTHPFAQAWHVGSRRAGCWSRRALLDHVDVTEFPLAEVNEAASACGREWRSVSPDGVGALGCLAGDWLGFPRQVGALQRRRTHVRIVSHATSHNWRWSRPLCRDDCSRRLVSKPREIRGCWARLHCSVECDGFPLLSTDRLARSCDVRSGVPVARRTPPFTLSW